MDTSETAMNNAVEPAAPRHPPLLDGPGAAPDEEAHLDGRLMHELSALNYQLGQYVLRYWDADAGRVTAIPTEDEQALANSVAAASDAIRARVARRKARAGHQSTATRHIRAVQEAGDGLTDIGDSGSR